MGLPEWWASLTKLTNAHISFERKGKDIWAASGTAILSWKNPSLERIHVFEAGEWSDNYGRKFQYSNAYEWHWNTDRQAIEISHLRRGADKPVFLVSLSRDQANQSLWKSGDPHLCGADLYHATICVQLDRLKIIWLVEGPSKMDSIISVYSK